MNPRRISETIYFTKFDSLSNLNVILRSTQNPTNSPNAALRSTHDLRQTAINALEIDTRSHDELEMLWYHLSRMRQQPARNQIDATEKYPRITRIRNKRKQIQYLTRFDNLSMSSGQRRERFYWFNNQYNLYLAYNSRRLRPFIYSQRGTRI